LGAGVTIGNLSFLTSSAAAYTIGTGGVGAETLTLNDGGAITMGPLVTSNELFNSAIVLGLDSSAKTYAITNNSASTLTFASNISTGLAGTAGTKTLTFGGAGNIVLSGNFNRDGVTNGGTNASNLAITKIGSGTLTVNPASNFGSASGAVVVNAGTLALDFTNTVGATGTAGTDSLLSSFSPLTLGGGTLQIIGNAANARTQTFNGTTFSTGASTISMVNNGAAPTLALGAITFSGYSPVQFSTVGTITTTSAGGGTLGLIAGDFATYGTSDWATTSLTTGGAGSSPYTIKGLSSVTGGYTTSMGGTGQGVNLDLQSNYTAGANVGATTIRFNTPTATTVNVNGKWVVPNAILVTPNMGANNAQIISGNWYAKYDTNAATEWVVQNNTQGFFVNTGGLINDKGGAGALTYVQSGPGTVQMPGTSTVGGGTGINANNYTGQSYLLGGSTYIKVDADLGAPGTGAAVNLGGGTIVAGATFTLDNVGANKRPITLLSNGGGLAAAAGFTMTVDGVVSGGAGTGGLTIGIPASSANGSVAGLLPGTGSIANGQTVDTANTTAVFGTGIVALTGANTYTGGTTILGGSTLNINGINALGGANYGGLTLKGGVLQYAIGFAGNGSGDLTSVGTAGVTLASGGGTIDINGNAVTYANSIGNSGSGALTVTSTAGGGTLTLAGANTYTGGTTITSGTLRVTNTTGSATGTGAVALSGGSLSGTGIISGVVTQAAGSTIARSTTGTTLSLGGLTFNGGTLSFALDGGTGLGTQTSSLLTATNATFTATPTLTLSGILNAGKIVNGEIFTLFSSPNAITGSSFLSSLGSLGNFGRITLTASQSGNSIIATASGSTANLVWAGGVAGLSGSITGDTTTWDNAQTSTVAGNWNNGGAKDYFYDNDTVTFNDTVSPGTGTLNHTVNLTTANAPGSVTVTTAGAYTFTGSGTGKITGGTSLLLTGGTLNLNLANDYTGGTTINATTTLKAGIAGALPGTGIVAVKGTLDLGGFNQTIGTLSDGSVSSGVITDTGAAATLTTTVTGSSSFSGTIQDGSGSTSLTLAGGTLVLSGTNTYSGLTSINGGVLQISAGNNIGNASATNTISLNNGTLDSTSGTYDLGVNRAVALAGTTSTTEVDVGALTLSGVISGTALTKTGAGTLTLTGSNTYTGATTLSAGVLNIQNATALGTTAAGTTVATGAALQIQGGITVGAEALTLNGTGVSGSGGALRNISDTNSYAGAITLGSASRINSDAGTLTLSGGFGGAFGLTFGGAGATTVSGGIGTGANSVTYDGAGTLTLSGANTFTGNVSVTSGTLFASLGRGSGSAGGSSLGETNTGGRSITVTNATMNWTTSNILGAAGSFAAANYAAVSLTNSSLNLTGAGANNNIGALTLDGGTINMNNGTGAAANYQAVGLAGSVTVINHASSIANNAPTGSFNGINLGENTGIAAGYQTTFNINNTIGGTGDGALPDLTIAAPLVNGITGSTAISTGINKTGAGLLLLTAASTYTGTTTITAGTLQLGDGTSPNDGTITSSTSVVNNGALIYNRFGSLSYGGVISGTGTVAVSGTGSQTLTGANTYNGATTVSAGATLQLGNGTTGNDGTIANSLSVVDNGTLIYNRFGSTSYSGVISGSGSVQKLGAGTQTLTSTSTYIGGTTVSFGTLAVTGSGKLGTGNVTVAAGATLTLGSGVETSVNYVDNLSNLILSNSTSSVFLNFSGTETVAGLSLGGIFQTPGLYYGAAYSGPDSGGTVLSNFSGTGDLLVVPEPGAGALLMSGIGMLIMVRRSRRLS
jgi:autotransporter-associated beta strand protein